MQNSMANLSIRIAMKDLTQISTSLQKQPMQFTDVWTHCRSWKSSVFTVGLTCRTDPGVLIALQPQPMTIHTDQRQYDYQLLKSTGTISSRVTSMTGTWFSWAEIRRRR